LRAAGVDHDGSGDDDHLLPWLCVCRDERGGLAHGGFHLPLREMPLVMKAKARRSRSLDSGTTRMPRMPTTTRSPLLDVAEFAAGGAAFGETTTSASMRWFSTSIHFPALRIRVRWLVVE
jgi:hypothetical protein